MFKINSSLLKVDNAGFTESRNVDNKKTLDRFINISPKNYIKVMQEFTPKKSLIPMILISIMDKDNRISMTLDELSDVLDYPKTGLSVIFSEYKKKDFLQKIRNGLYMINPLVSYRGSKYERDKLLHEYNKIKDRDGDV